MGERPFHRWRPGLALLACCWLLAAGSAAARAPRHRAVAQRHAWQRDVGLRQTQASRLSGRQRRALVFDGVKRDVPIRADAVAARIEALRRDPNARVQQIGTGDLGNPVYRIDIPAAAPAGRGRPLKVLVGAWIHGNETAGPEAALELVDRALRQRSFRQRFDLSVIVKVDPFGTRARPDGVDLNRAFKAGAWTAETRAIRRSVSRDAFDLFVDLHGAVRNGFFLIRGQDDGALSRRILSAMKTGALLDAPAASTRVGPYDLHSLGGASSDTAGTFKGFMARRGVPYSYTLEAPRALTPRQQVSGMLKLLRSTLDNVARHGRF